MVTVADLQALQEQTQAIEEEKLRKKEERLEKKRLKEEALRRAQLEKWVAPLLFLVTLAVSLIVWALWGV